MGCVVAEDRKRCTACGLTKPIQDFHVRATQCKLCRKNLGQIWRDSHKDHLRQFNSDRIVSINQSILGILGHSCSMCPETQVDFLTVDHIYNDRKQERRYNSIVWKNDILKGRASPDRYQILCRNCNEAKQRRHSFNLLKDVVHTGQTKICRTCLVEKDLAYFYKHSEGARRASCSECVRQSRRSVTIACYDFLGGSCRCCWETDPFKLNIDHIHNDGHETRHLGVGYMLCKKILLGKLPVDRYQLLCANCNYSKMRHGSCVHERYACS